MADSIIPQVVEDKIKHLAESYTPEWVYNREDPDIGTTISLIYGDQMAKIHDMMDGITDRYHTEFVNLLDLSLLPAKPAKGIVVMDLVQETIPGAHVRKGTKLSADRATGDGDNVIFETDHSLYVTNAKIQEIFLSNAESGKIVPVLGDFEEPAYTDIYGSPASVEEEELEAGLESAPSMQSFTLFGEKNGLGNYSLVCYHPSVFDSIDNDIFVRISGNKKLVNDILTGEIELLYLTEDGPSKFDSVSLLDDNITFVLRKNKENKKVTIDGRDYSVIVFDSKNPVKSITKVSDITFSSQGEAEEAESVTNGTTDLDKNSFQPFGDTLNLFSECFIGHDNYFSKVGSKVTLKFHLDIKINPIDIPKEEEDKSLKIIKRKPKKIVMGMPANVFANEIVLEYFNGIGWQKLETDQLHEGLFAEDVSKDMTVTFVCPGDWEPTSVGSSTMRYLRIRLIKADNCYMRPAYHNYPVISDTRISFSYENMYVQASKIESIFGCKKVDITNQVHTGDGFYAFRNNGYLEDALYMSFKKRMEEGPVSIFFHMSDELRFTGLKVRFEYSTEDGFVPLKIIDYTGGFTKSGIVMFLPPPDMAKLTIEDKRRFWIRLVKISKYEEEDPGLFPRITNIMMNAVMVSNIDTKDERPFFMNDASPNMIFDLGERNILYTDIWVNEIDKLSVSQMRQMEEENPDNVRAEKFANGNYSAFYVKWTETDSFFNSTNKRVYILDRMNSTIRFGDGVHTDYPKVSYDVAFTAVTRCCVGAAGNVPALSINSPIGTLPYIGEIVNPISAYGGSDTEKLSAALERGANLLHSRGRIVSVGDYEKAILSYSDKIDQVKCLVGSNYDKFYEDSRDITILLLMKDSDEGSYSFHRLEDPLKNYLKESCELTISPDGIFIAEPVFVEISVDIWADVIAIEDSFEVQSLVQECLDEYISPHRTATHRGWKIGTMPKHSQLMMRLGSLKSKLIIKKLAISAQYSDKEGKHIKDIDDLKIEPYMVPRSGTHKVHIIHS
ncbi:MAG: hypothetical protein K6F00_04325 [Lachnospiraceae bacterium]|nr:hypothetical protein [Lachnospiraceae bacterium]